MHALDGHMVAGWIQKPALVLPMQMSFDIETSQYEKARGQLTLWPPWVYKSKLFEPSAITLALKLD